MISIILLNLDGFLEISGRGHPYRLIVSGSRGFFGSLRTGFSGSCLGEPYLMEIEPGSRGKFGLGEPYLTG